MTEQAIADEASESAAPDPIARTRHAWWPLRYLWRHEWTLAMLLSIGLAIAMTWPAVTHLRKAVAADIVDPALQSWQMAWIGWAVKHAPTQLWQTNAFHGEYYPLAYSDSLLGYLPFSLFGMGAEAAIVRYNILFILVFALSFFGAYVLTRQLGARVGGAAVAGAGFAYAPWHYAQFAHLNILSTGGIALALAMLARGHGYSLRDGYRPERVRPGWALAGWLVAAWQITLGFGLGLPFGYVLGACGVLFLLGWLRWRPPFSKRLLRADVVGILAFGLVTAGMAVPYFKVINSYPYGRRQLGEVLFYSPELRGFITPGPNSWLLGDRTKALRENIAGGMEAFIDPGWVLIALALVGLLVSAWGWRRRVLLVIGLLGVGTLTVGLQAPTTIFYRAVYKFAPGWDAIRAPGRLVVWVTLILAVLAAGAVTAIGDRCAGLVGRAPRTLAKPLLAAGLLLPVSLVVLEGVQTIPFETVPKGPADVAHAQGPVLVLPMSWRDDQLSMLWTTETFVPLMNGSSGFFPAAILAMRKATRSFPDSASVRYLHDRGVKTVVVLKHPHFVDVLDVDADSTMPPNALTGPIDGLGITREERPDVVVYTFP